MASSSRELKQQRKHRLKQINPPDDKKFPELDKGYPDSLIQKHAERASPHVDESQPVNALLARGDYYQYRGPRFISKDDKRKTIYNDYKRSAFSSFGVYYGKAFKHRKPPLYVWASEEDWKRIAMFPEREGSFPGANGTFYYLHAQGQRHPYPWQAHHLIPESAFSEQNAQFSDEQMMVLQRSFYNINNGHNIIMLPADPKYCPVHKLIAHCSNHPAYNIQVILEMSKASEAIDDAFEKARKIKDHPAFFEAILKEFHELEDRLWNFVIKISNASVTIMSKEEQEAVIKEHGKMIGYTEKSLFPTLR